jgi:hypothetical protein
MASSGTSSITLDDFTLSSAGSIAIGGALSVTLGDFTSDGTISLYLLSDDALDAVADNVERIAFGAELERLKFGGIGWLVAHGESDITLDAFTLSAAATLGNTGTESGTLSSFTVSAAGSGGWYVDSVAGNDSNSGRTSSAPLQTLAALDAKVPVANEIIYLKRGSTFSEQLTALATGVTVKPYGAGARPIVDGRNIASAGAFTKTGGRTNVYQIAWTHSFDDGGGKCRHRAWEAGAMMRRVTWTGNLSNDLAAVDSTPGTFLSDTPTSGGPDTIYIHPLGNTDPRVDGKVYQFTSRRWAVQLYDAVSQASVYSIDAIGNAHADGSIVVDGYVEDCYARDGRVHNCFVRGRAVDCYALGIDIYDPAGIGVPFVTYYDDASPGPSQRNTSYKGCVADSQTGYTGGGAAFYVHTAGSRAFATIQYEECSAIGYDVAYSGTNADLFLYYKCTYSACRHGILSVPNGGGVQSKVLLLGGHGTDIPGVNDAKVYSATISSGFVYEVHIHGYKHYRQNGGQGPILFDVPDAYLNVQRCSFVIADTSSTGHRLTAGNITWKRNINRGQPIVIGSSGAQVASYDADYNCDYTNGSMVWNTQFPSSADHIGLAAWQTYLIAQGLGAGKEANTIVTDPQFVDPANADFTIQNATVISLGAGAEQDEDDDADLQALWNLYRVA